MIDPTDKSQRPGRPARRFSPLKPAKGRAAGLAPDPHIQGGSEPRSDAAQAGSGEARIAKVMSRAGLCSRRDAEGWIFAGRVAVNGTVIASPALNIGPGDRITVDGFPIEKAERTRLFMFHKTRGLVTTAKDPEGRPTIYNALPADLPRLMTIGRLDINTEGLLLLTNDGGLARLLELPSTGWVRRYRVRAKGSIDQATLDQLAGGITIDDVDYAGIEARLDRVQGANLWLTMGLREGKNREIKRVLEHLGLAVNRLIRLSFGPFQLGDLAENAVEEVNTTVLRDQLGPVLAQEAGVDLDGPPAAAVVTRDVRKAKADERRTARRERDAPAGQQPRAGTPAHLPRQHVSVLRASRVEATEGPRRKTQRSATEDRKGRSVAVERVTVASRKDRPAAPTRNARRFEHDRTDASGEAGRPPRRDREDRPIRSAPEAPVPQRAHGRTRTVRQADADYRRPEQDDRRPARPPFRTERPHEGGTRPPRRAAPREGRSDGRTRDERHEGRVDRPVRPGGGKPGFKGSRVEGRSARSAGGTRAPSGSTRAPSGGKRPPAGGKRPGSGGGGPGRPPKR